MALFTTTSGLYGGVLWSGELQGFILHEMMPISNGHASPVFCVFMCACAWLLPCRHEPRAAGGTHPLPAPSMRFD
jgi:hypothetical protein